MSKEVRTAVVYHSLHGTVESVAKAIAQKTDAQLIPLTIPGAAQLKGFQMYAKLGFMATFKSKPKIVWQETDLSVYDRIIIGTPVWGSTFSPAIRSFLSQFPTIKPHIAGAFFCHLGGLGTAPVKFTKFLNAGPAFPIRDGIIKNDSDAESLALSITAALK